MEESQSNEEEKKNEVSFEISDEDIKKIDISVEEKIKTLNIDDFMDEDDRIEGQEFIVLSIAKYSKDDVEKGKTNLCGINIKGVFSTFDEATEHSKSLFKKNNNFDIYVCKTCEWIILPPPKYRSMEDYLSEDYEGNDENDIQKNFFRNYFKENLRNKELFEKRKNDTLNKVKKSKSIHDIIIDDNNDNNDNDNNDNNNDNLDVSIELPSVDLKTCPNSVSLSEKSWADKIEEEEN